MPYPEIVEEKLKASRKAADFDPSETDPEDELTLEQTKWEEKRALNESWDTKLKEEENRVAGVKENMVDISKKWTDKSQDNAGGLIRPSTYNWLAEGYRSGLYGCNTQTCSTMRAAGATVPNKVFNEKTDVWEDNTVNYNNRTYSGGDSFPIITGNTQFDERASNLGLNLRPKDSLPENADLVRVNYDNTPGNPNYNPDARQRGTTHSTIAGTQNGEMTSFYNSGNIARGISNSTSYTRSSDFDNTDQNKDNRYGKNRLMNYEGNLPYLRSQARRHSNVSPISPNLQAELVKNQKVKPVSTNAKITANTSGINSLFKKLKKK